jgi:hypothetical protein
MVNCWEPLKILIPKCENSKYVTMGNQQPSSKEKVQRLGFNPVDCLQSKYHRYIKEDMIWKKYGKK